MRRLTSSPLLPLARVTKPSRSPFGNGLAPHEGAAPVSLGMIQIWKILVAVDSMLYSLWAIPVPALIT